MGSTTSGNVSLFGWDTAFALTLDALNETIASQNATPADFDGLDTIGGAEVSGTWDTWQVAGGEGSAIYVTCPVATGTMTLEPDSYDLAGGSVTVQLTLKQVATGTPPDDPTAQPGTGQAQNFVANDEPADPFQTATVYSLDFPTVTGSAIYGAQAAFNAYFAANIGAFAALFGVMYTEEEAITADKQWLKPQVASYAMAQTGSGDSLESYFALLGLTTLPPANTPLPQQSFDLSMFSFFPDTTPATNAVFSMSQTLAAQNILLPSVVATVEGASIDDFEIVNNNTTVRNKNQITWGNFDYLPEGADEPSTVSPVIAANNLQLMVDGSSIHFSVAAASFVTPDNEFNVSINADQYFEFGAVQQANGEYYFTPAPGLGTNSIHAAISPTTGFLVASIVEGLVISVVGAIFGGLIGGAIAGEAVAEVVEEGAELTVDLTDAAVEDGIDVADTSVTDVDEAAATEAAEAIADDGASTSSNTGIFANKWKIFGGIVGSLLGAPVSMLPQIIQAASQGEYQDPYTIDQFATNFTETVEWPALPTWQVTGGQFADAFMLAGQLSSD